MFICFRGGFDLGLGGCDVVSWERGFKFFFLFFWVGGGGCDVVVLMSWEGSVM